MKVKVDPLRCKGCVWMINKQVCPFVRCVYRNGFIVGRVKNREQKRD